MYFSLLNPTLFLPIFSEILNRLPIFSKLIVAFTVSALDGAHFIGACYLCLVTSRNGMSSSTTQKEPEMYLERVFCPHKTLFGPYMPHSYGELLIGMHWDSAPFSAV